MHQVGTPEADGVSYITQHPILPLHYFTYRFRAFPPGTQFYHAVQRADGLYSELIGKDVIPGNVYDNDKPDQHTLLLLMNWYIIVNHFSMTS